MSLLCLCVSRLLVITHMAIVHILIMFTGQCPPAVINMCMVIMPLCILFFFFMGIFIGTSYIQQHLKV